MSKQKSEKKATPKKSTTKAKNAITPEADSPAEETAITPEADSPAEETATTTEADSPVEDTANSIEDQSLRILEMLGGDDLKRSALAVTVLTKVPGVKIKHNILNGANVTKVSSNPEGGFDVIHSKVVGSTYNKTIKKVEAVPGDKLSSYIKFIVSANK